MNGVVVCGEVVDVLWDDIAGFNPLELVYAYETVVYDSGGSRGSAEGGSWDGC